MIKKTINYIDIDGNKAQEDVYFHLYKSELVSLVSEGYVDKADKLQKTVAELVAEKRDENDPAYYAVLREYTTMIKEIVNIGYGKRIVDEDGKSHFVKNDKLRWFFIGSDVYNALIDELMYDGDAAAEFVQGMFPAEIVNEIKKEQELKQVQQPAMAPISVPASATIQPPTTQSNMPFNGQYHVPFQTNTAQYGA